MDNNALNVLGRRAGFNSALRHFKSVNEFASEISRGVNLADALNQALEAGRVERYQVPLALNSLLVDKFKYATRAYNLRKTVESVDSVIERVSGWNALHVVVAYHHPQAGLFTINPKEPSSWEPALPLLKDELMVVYAGGVSPRTEAKTLAQAADDLIALLHGRNVKDKQGYSVEGRGPTPVVRPRPAPAAVTPESPAEPDRSPDEATGAAPAATAVAEDVAKKRRITPRYSVLVSNELFHNGNVEAWKKIIESYKTRHPSLDVLIWYENERINDINTLFKWGKVKHGTPIMVSVVGDDIKDVAKLQRYLYEGASPRFEVFLRGGVDRVLDLF